MNVKKVERHIDDRGFLFFASEKLLDFNYKYLTIGTMEPGTKRGGHYHKRINEKLLCVTGVIRLILNGEEVILWPGDIADIPVETTHVLYNDELEIASFIEFKSEEFDKNDPDTYVPSN